MKRFSLTLLALCLPFGMTSLARALAPMVLTHPESQMIQTGASTTLSVVVDVSGPLTYQWKKDGVDLPSSNSPTYTLSNAQGTNAGSYTVVVTNADGSCEAGPAAVFVGTRRTVFVSSSAAGSNNGTSWTNAYTSLTTALSNSLDGDDIWVAAGTYKPSTTGNRDATFTVGKFVRLFGGFNGTETALEQRNWNANVTTLSGDLSGNDTGLGGNQGDNSKRVVTVSSSSGAVIDGFRVSGGSNTIPAQQPDFGAGIGFLSGGYGSMASSAVIRNCVFRWNSAVSYGGAVGLWGTSSTPLTIQSCVFIQNSAPSNGGGAIQIDNCPLVVRDSLFDGNSTGGSGGGSITANNTRDVVVFNSVFRNNAASSGTGAGGIRAWTSNAAKYRIIQSTFSSNTGPRGAVYFEGTPQNSNCLFANSIIVGSGASPVTFPVTTYLLSDQTISGTGNTVGTPLFVNAAVPLGADGIFGSADDGLALQPGSPGINAGSDSLVPAAITLDAAGRPRLSQQVDMGAYELPQPQISQHPVSVALSQNNGTNFSVTAAGNGTLTYQWQKDGVDIPGATSSTFSLASAKPWHIGDYTVKVTDANGTITSNAASLSLNGINSGIWRGLVGYYPFNGSSNDVSFLANHLSVSGPVLGEDRNGSNSAYSFQSEGSALFRTNSIGPNASQAQSISVWIKPQTLSGIRTIFGLSKDFGSRFFLSLNNNQIVGSHGNDSNYQQNLFTSPTLAVDTWYQVILTSGGNQNTMSCYLNGTKIADGISGTNASVGSGFWIVAGADVQSGFVSSFHGLIDDCRIYNRALSDSDAALLFESEDPDTDGDGIRDRFETGTGVYVSPTNTGTNPAVADTDGDGLSDGQELNIHSSNPNLKDTDGDGFEDGFEVLTGFSPALATSTPEALSAIAPAVEFRFNAANGVSYRIESSTDLTNWSVVENSIAGAGAPVIRFYTTDGITRRFYRARRN